MCRCRGVSVVVCVDVGGRGVRVSVVVCVDVGGRGVSVVVCVDVSGHGVSASVVVCVVSVDMVSVSVSSCV